jgi:hypothetical protein
VAVLVLSPFDHHSAPVNREIADLINEEFPMPLARFARQLDHHFELG